MIRFGAKLLFILFALSACTDAGPGNTYDGSSASGSLSRFNSDTIRLRHLDSVNALRTERGLPPIRLSAQLNAAAETHARDISVQERAWNFGSDGSSPQDRAVRSGFGGIVYGENVAETFKSELLVMQSWLNDPRSRAAMLNPKVTHIGYSWYQETNGKVWWVQMLAGQSAPMVTAGLQ